MRNKIILSILILSIIALVFSGCGGTTTPTIPSDSLVAVITSSTTSGEAPLEITFDASESSSAEGSEIVSYQWDFKDGNTGNGETINHTFSSTGSYNVELTVTDNKGATDSTTKTITLLPDDLEFIATIEEVDTPEKIGNYMVENFTYEYHDGVCKDTYILWKTQKGRCSDFAQFATIIANYHGYETYSIAINANYPGYGNVGHALGVYAEDGKYTYSSNQYYYSGIKFNTFEEIVNHCCSNWTPPIEWSGYCAWNHDCERVEESPNY